MFEQIDESIDNSLPLYYGNKYHFLSSFIFVLIDF